MTVTKRRLKRDARREQLLRVAITCYGEFGVERAGHGDIAKRACVSTATVFNYFATREKLTEAVFQAVHDTFLDMFSEHPPVNATPQARIQHLADSFATLVQQQPDILKVTLNWSCSFGQSVRPQYLEFQKWLLDGIQVRLHEGETDHSDARIILATAYNYARMKLDNTPDDILKRFVNRIIMTLG